MTKDKNEWSRLSIKDVYEGLYDGPHATPKPSDNGPVFLGIKNITEDGQLDLSEIKHISDEDFPNWTKRVIPRKDDIVFSYEATLNRYCIIPEGFRGCLGRRLALIRPDKRKINPSFLYYYFFSDEWRNTIARNILTGSTVDRIPISNFPDFEIRIPPLNIQTKVASILSAYDVLVENNNHRIKLLEEMAQIIYKEWFVKFRFPGYEKIEIVKTELGPLPANWKIERIGQRFLTVLGGTPSRNKPEFWDNGNIPWINSGKVNELRIIDESELITQFGLEKSSTKLMPKRTTVVAITGATLGQVSLLELRACANQSVVGIYDEENNYNEYIYLTICNMIDKIIMNAGGGAQQHINKDIINNTKIIVPDIDTIDSFREIVSNIFDMIRNLLVRNKNLLNIRNLLLPKLVSGEINVENMDIDIGGE